MKTRTAALLVIGLLAAAHANAQSPRPLGHAFAAVMVGSQTVSTLSASSQFDLFGRTGTVDTLRRRTDAGLIEVTVAPRIAGPLAAGASAMRARTKQLISYDARVPLAPPPSTQIFPTSGFYRDAEHQETQLHFFASWVFPFNDKVAIDFNGGPSIFYTRLDNITTMDARAFPVITKDSDTAVGYNAGFGLRALLVKNAGLAFGIRYAHATADFSTGAHEVGGLQVRAGLGVVF